MKRTWMALPINFDANGEKWIKSSLEGESAYGYLSSKTVRSIGK
jgi:hypothetical protein